VANQAVEQEWKMKINPQASLTAHKEIFIRAPSEIVWKMHTDIDAWSQWQPGITMAKLEGPLAVGSLFQFKSGGLTITATIQMVEPNQRIGWTGQALGTQARHVWLLTPQHDGTLLTTDESMTGWLVSLLKLVMPKFLERSLETWLQSLKSKAESNSPDL
jgi:uncharacterized protein YndB with AHSA1/START domain